MEAYIFCRTLDEIPFTISTRHPLLKKGVFKCFDFKEPIPISSELFLDYVFYREVDKEKIPLLLQSILPYSIEEIEKSWINQWVNTLSKELKANIQRYKIQVIEIIKSIETPVTSSLLIEKIENILSRNYRKNKSIVDEFIKNKDYKKLYDYDSFELCLFDPYIVEKQDTVLSDNDVMKHIVEHMANLEEEKKGYSLIHYICRYSTPEMIQYIIEKGVELECKNIYGNMPICFIFYYSTVDMAKYIIDRGVSFESSMQHIRNPEIFHYLNQKYPEREILVKYSNQYILCAESFKRISDVKS